MTDKSKKLVFKVFKKKELKPRDLVGLKVVTVGVQKAKDQGQLKILKPKRVLAPIKVQENT